MLNNGTLKNYIMRIVCMIMLMLIQFDVCGYDIVYAFQQESEPQSALVLLDDETSVSDSQEEISEWSDPVYRNSSMRSVSDAIIPILAFSLSSPILGELSVLRRLFSIRTDMSYSQSYIHFCVFRI